MKPAYLLLNFCLAATALLASQWTWRGDPGSHWRDPQPALQADAKPERPDIQEQNHATFAAPEAQLHNLMDLLHEKTLFRPERQEISLADDSNPATAAEPPPPDADMELIAIGKVRDRAAAVILVRQQTTRARPTVRGRRTTAAAKDATPQSPRRHVYRVGDQVETTGYEITEITMNQVLLQRNGQERILSLETGDTGSEQRVKQAVLAAKAAEQQKAAAEEAQPAETPPNMPPPPPPPPPVPGMAGVPGVQNPTAANPQTTETLSREERIRRALEARRHILEQRRTMQQQ